MLPILCWMNSRSSFHTKFIYGTEVVIFSMPEVTALFPSPWSSGAKIRISIINLRIVCLNSNRNYFILEIWIYILSFIQTTYIIFPPSSRRKILLRHKEAVSIPALFLWFFLFPKFQIRKRIKWSLRQRPRIYMNSIGE